MHRKLAGLLTIPVAMWIVADLGIPEADELVLALRDLPRDPGRLYRSDGRLIPEAVTRQKMNAMLYFRAEAGVQALGRGLRHEDVQIRRESAWALQRLANGLMVWELVRLPGLDIAIALPDLQRAIDDSDALVRARSLSAIGYLGRDAAVLVPRLITLIESGDEDLKRAASSTLRRIGPPAAEALPALRTLLSHPDEQIRNQARMAIDSIEMRS